MVTTSNGGNIISTDSDIEEETSISLPDVDESDYDDLLHADFNEEEEDFLDEELSYEDGDNYHNNNQQDQEQQQQQQINHENDTVMDGRMVPKANKMNKHENDNASDNGNTDENGITFSDYILGTLIVRVVAAKDLKAVKQQSSRGGAIVGSLRDAIFNSDKKPKGTRINSFNSTMSSRYDQNQYQNQEEDRIRRRRELGGSGKKGRGRRLNNYQYGTANPYAKINFANQTEISSTVYDTLHPSFPRNEQAYFDVSLPVTHLAHVPDDYYQNDVNVHQKKSGGGENMKMKAQMIDDNIPVPPPPQAPVVTVVMRHDDHDEEEEGDGVYYNDKGSRNNNWNAPMKKKASSSNSDSKGSDDQSFFLGMASIDVTQLITGKVTYIDRWLTLYPQPSNNAQRGSITSHDKNHTKDVQRNENINITGQVRIICEYEICDSAPRPGDLVRLNGFVDPMDVYPIPASQIFRVDDVGISNGYIGNNNGNSITSIDCIDGDDLLVLSYRSNPEDWYCKFVGHRYMFISVERHTTAIERYQDELVEIVCKIASSPAAHVVQRTVKRLPEEGILYMGLEASMAGFGLAGRWLKGGVGTIVGDIVYATNLDGKSGTATNNNENENESGSANDSNENDGENLSITSSGLELDDVIDVDDDLSLDLNGDSSSITVTSGDQTNSKSQKSASTSASPTPLPSPSPSMPCCPISGQPMKEPVVAADGHTYEKKAIARWLRKSDISPLTGQQLPHKELVPNYLLISTFQSGVTSNTHSTESSTCTKSD